MKMTALFHIALLPDAKESAFAAHMNNVAFKNVSALQLTRTTAAFTHKLLKMQSSIPAYAWLVEVDLVTDREYDFAENIDRVQSAIKGMGVVTGVDVYTHLDADN